jgi:DnaJ-class molecular chaperone
MREKVDLTKVCGVSAYVTCSYCHGKRRFPGGKYRDQGEVVNCPSCNGLGAERVFLDLDQFQRLVTIVMNKTRSRSRWKPKQSPKRKSRT